jgi:hypothetical protein
MIGNITPQMPEKLVAYLHPGAPGLLLTAGADGYATSAFTWILSLDAGRLRFAVDEGGSTMANLQRSGQAALQIIGPGDISFLVKGRARALKPKLDGAAPYVIHLWEMEIGAGSVLAGRGHQRAHLRVAGRARSHAGLGTTSRK